MHRGRAAGQTVHRAQPAVRARVLHAACHARARHDGESSAVVRPAAGDDAADVRLVESRDDHGLDDDGAALRGAHR